ncbi:unnamed protein product, partial [Ectocarpus sp. 12 AP-2014]
QQRWRRRLRPWRQQAAHRRRLGPHRRRLGRRRPEEEVRRRECLALRRPRRGRGHPAALGVRRGLRPRGPLPPLRPWTPRGFRPPRTRASTPSVPRSTPHRSCTGSRPWRGERSRGSTAATRTAPDDLDPDDVDDDDLRMKKKYSLVF